MKKSRTSTLVAASLAILLQLVSPSVQASGITGFSFGGELGSVVSTNPTAIYYNPGALGFSGTQLMIDTQLVMRSSTWTHSQAQGDVPEPAGFEGASYGTAHSFLIAGLPQFGASFQLGKYLVVGAGVFVPWGGGSLTFARNERFANTMYPGAADGITRWHAYEAGMGFFYGTAGAAVRFGPLSIGATFNLIRAFVAMKRAQTSSGNNDITREQRISADFSENVASFGLGVLWEMLPDQVWLGASYQAQPGLGELSLDGTYTVDATVNVADQVVTREATMHMAMPDILRSGMRVRPSPSFELRMSLSFTRWSVNQTQCLGIRNLPCTVKTDGTSAPGSGVIKVVRRNWNDTIGIQAGLSYWFIPSLELFAGVSYEQAAVPDATLDPLTADAQNFTLALGGRLRLFDTWFVALSYNHKQFLPRDNTGRSDLANPGVGSASRGADGGGKYESWLATLHLNVTKTF